MSRRTLFPGLRSLLGAALILALPAVSVYAHPLFYSPQSAPFNTKFKKWSAQWWQFVISFPAAENPLLDETGARCVVGQRGPVWFLMGAGGGTVSRSCEIPAGKALFFPVLNFADINTESQTAEELRAEIAPCMDAVTALSVEVDGQSIIDFDQKDRFRIQSKVFDVAVPDGGFLDPGTYSPVVDDGFYVMLKPLPVGEHTVHFAGARGGCPFSQDPFSLDVNYSLNVVPVTLE